KNLPLCSNNSSCEPHPTASGIVFHDINANGIFDGTDTTLQDWIVYNIQSKRAQIDLTDTTLQDWIVYNQQNNWSNYTQANGEYIVKLDSGATNTTALQCPFSPYISQTNPTNYQITPTSGGSQGNHYDFAIQFVPNVHELEVSIAAGFARPGFDQWVSVLYKNNGTISFNSNITVKVLKPSGFHLLDTNPAHSSMNGDTILLE
ncbi:MAG: hypothetical protein NZ108_10555, partial [Bacteroidia bacterium]|nr:hypothetical protein [Bacteroidia bacterium]